jgi:two-component system LytT family response regulator
MKINVLIVDDELKSLAVTKMILGQFSNLVEQIFTASTIDDAYQKIVQHEPELVLLDVELSSHTGFDLIKRFDNPSFKVIFLTAHDKYAIGAMKVEALDYLLKPLDADELHSALLKVLKHYTTQPAHTNVQDKIAGVAKKGKIIVPTQKELLLVDVDTILFCKAEGGYTSIYMNTNKIILSSKDLKTYQGILQDFAFFRIHDSYLVNYTHITSILSDNFVQLSNQTTIPLSRRRRSEFINWLQKVS